MADALTVRDALRVAYATGQQVTLVLTSGAKLSGVIIERLWRTSLRVWMEPDEPVEDGEDMDKAIVGRYAVAAVEFGYRKGGDD